MSSSWNELFVLVFMWFRRLFIIAKGLFIIYLSVKFIIRYKKGTNKWITLENIMLVGIIILDMDIILFELWHSLNVIYSVFFLNCIMKMVTAYYF